MPESTTNQGRSPILTGSNHHPNAIGATLHGSPGSAMADGRGSSGSSFNMFVDFMTKPEKALMLAAVFVAVACSIYAAARVDALATNVADYKRDAELREHHALEIRAIERAASLAAIEQLKLTYTLALADDKDRFGKLERQYRMTELKLDDWNVTARRAGLVLKGDYSGGPGGNPDAESFNMAPPTVNVPRGSNAKR
jgi:hypothetical protein